MKIYFSAAIYQKGEHQKAYLAIVKLLKNWGHTVRHEHITDHSLEYVLEQSVEEIKAHYQNISRWMREADTMVIEASFPSSVNIGHEITLALTKGKPVIVMYRKGLRPILLLSIENPNLVCVEYTNETLENDLESALDYISGQMDVRFNLFMSSKMSQYLEQISKDEKVSKSHFIRNLIKEHMKQNPGSKTSS